MKKLRKWVIVLLVIIACATMFKINVKAENKSVGTYDELMTALSYAHDGDIIEVTEHIVVSAQTTIGYSDKCITLKRTTERGYIEFYYNAGGSTVQNLVFDGNDVLASNSFLDVGNGIIINDCTFQNCQTSGNGAAVGIWDATAEFNRCIFKDNTANIGGCVNISNGSSILFNECSFQGNEAIDKGGILFVGSTTPTITFQDCIVTENKASTGAAFYNSGAIVLNDCVIYNNDLYDVYIDDYGRLSLNSSFDDLKALYEENSLILQGCFDDSDVELDISNTLTGAKGILFKCEVKENSEPTEEPTTTPTPGESVNSESDASGSSQPQTTYNTYSPTINNVVQTPTEPQAPKTTQTADSVEASATVTDEKESRTYTTTTDKAGNSSLEITEGQNTITINISVGAGESGEAALKETDEVSSQEVGISEPSSVASASTETVYIQKNVNWIDVVQMILLGLIVLHLLKGDKIKGIFQRKNQE